MQIFSLRRRVSFQDQILLWQTEIIKNGTWAERQFKKEEAITLKAKSNAILQFENLRMESTFL